MSPHSVHARDLLQVEMEIHGSPWMIDGFDHDENVDDMDEIDQDNGDQLSVAISIHKSMVDASCKPKILQPPPSHKIIQQPTKQL